MNDAICLFAYHWNRHQVKDKKLSKVTWRYRNKWPLLQFLLFTIYYPTAREVWHQKGRTLISSSKLLMNLAGTKHFQTLLLTKKLPFSTKPFTIYSIVLFDLNIFTCDGKELVKITFQLMKWSLQDISIKTNNSQILQKLQFYQDHLVPSYGQLKIKTLFISYEKRNIAMTHWSLLKIFSNKEIPLTRLKRMNL